MYFSTPVISIFMHMCMYARFVYTYAWVLLVKVRDTNSKNDPLLHISVLVCMGAFWSFDWCTIFVLVSDRPDFSICIQLFGDKAIRAFLLLLLVRTKLFRLFT